MNKTNILILLGIASAAITAVAADRPDLSKLDLSKLPPPASEQDVTYAKQIRPLFEASCLRCHGEQKPKAGLRLDSREGVLKGSKEGKVITPGDSKQSLLVIAVAQLDPETAMPPKRRARPGGPPPGERPPGAPAGDEAHGPGPGGPGGPGGRPPGPPPKPLTPEQVGLVRAWIDQGAK